MRMAAGDLVANGDQADGSGNDREAEGEPKKVPAIAANQFAKAIVEDLEFAAEAAIGGVAALLTLAGDVEVHFLEKAFLPVEVVANEEEAPVEVTEAVGWGVGGSGLGLSPDLAAAGDDLLGMESTVATIEGQVCGDGMGEEEVAAEGDIVEVVLGAGEELGLLGVLGEDIGEGHGGTIGAHASGAGFSGDDL